MQYVRGLTGPSDLPPRKRRPEIAIIRELLAAYLEAPSKPQPSPPEEVVTKFVHLDTEQLLAVDEICRHYSCGRPDIMREAIRRDRERRYQQKE